MQAICSLFITFSLMKAKSIEIYKFIISIATTLPRELPGGNGYEDITWLAKSEAIIKPCFMSDFPDLLEKMSSFSKRTVDA